MKKFLIGIVFGIALFLTQKTNITYAANLSDNFTQILIDNDQNNLLNNSEIAHISVKFNDQKNKLLLSFFPVPAAKHYPTIPVYSCIFQQISFHIQFLKIASKHQ